MPRLKPPFFFLFFTPIVYGRRWLNWAIFGSHSHLMLTPSFSSRVWGRHDIHAFVLQGPPASRSCWWDLMPGHFRCCYGFVVAHHSPTPDLRLCQALGRGERIVNSLLGTSCHSCWRHFPLVHGRIRTGQSTRTFVAVRVLPHRSRTTTAVTVNFGAGAARRPAARSWIMATVGAFVVVGLHSSLLVNRRPASEEPVVLGLQLADPSGSRGDLLVPTRLNGWCAWA